ncbi:hypothetical protein HPO96_37190 [Kribbella sandramycini]|uniref:Uncharacterized protein n=1 Tax=Kribbella sandramycini TaxID=60450 RepID=A0A7Y4L9L6_9ACTN|nr:hypothetical protein [Kribbella sandramycini]MBB6564438.1 hypothetical protein [Kribbella sandramycini]NOL45896.1 hypothetical protein [Kribbella sandramycini]
MTDNTAPATELRRVRVAYLIPSLSADQYETDVVLEAGDTVEDDIPAMLSVKHFSHSRDARLIRVVGVTDLDNPAPHVPGRADPIVWTEVDSDLAGKEWRCNAYPEMRISQANPNGMFWIWATNYPRPIGRNAFYDRAVAAAEKWGREHR